MLVGGGERKGEKRKKEIAKGKQRKYKGRVSTTCIYTYIQFFRH